MRRSDIWFFGVIIIMLFLVIMSLLTTFVIPVFISTFFWVALLPYVIIKLFFRGSKLFKWLNKEIF